MAEIVDLTKAKALLGKSVGDGECVALVQKVGALNTHYWRKGERVKGDMLIRPGTVIATFDNDGTYGNHTNETSHAAIYLGQDMHGIQVIDQWTDSGIQPAHERTLHFGAPKKVNDGDQFYVVE